MNTESHHKLKASPKTPREEFTDIRISRTGKWYTRSLPIQNNKILQYFKSNLRRDEKGIYIHNTFGEFSEKGYIQVEGPLLKVLDINSNGFTLENKEFIANEKVKLILDGQMIPYLYIPQLKAWAIFSKEAALPLADSLEISREDSEDSQENFLWKGNKVSVHQDISWS